MQHLRLSTTAISYKATNSFTPIALALHQQDMRLAPYVNRFFSLANFEEQLAEKAKMPVNRELLYRVLSKQHSDLKLSQASKKNIADLALNNTFTVTTGHQLCLFTGPLYFIYKIIHTIKLCQTLKTKYPEQNFVPLFWMASEDHDFEEIASVVVNQQKITWELNANQAPVGRLQTDTLAPLISELGQILGDGASAKSIQTLVNKCYSKGENLASATRKLVYDLFGKHGLVILDGDSPELKRSFAPLIKKELLEQFSLKALTTQSEALAKLFKTQISPRNINLFLFEKGQRLRIDKKGDHFSLVDTPIEFTEAEILKRLEEHPEDFSPNVALRPLYQEFVLPNLCYVGGGGELAYWLQLKTVFGEAEVTFPLLALRNSALLVESDQVQKLQQLDLGIADLFLDEHQLRKSLVDKYQQADFYELNEERNALKLLFEQLAENTQAKTPGLSKHIAANLQKNLHFIDGLEKKLLRKAKLKHDSTYAKLDKVRVELFPNNSLQERKSNVFTYLHRYGFELIDLLLEDLDPENTSFSVVSIERTFALAD